MLPLFFVQENLVLPLSLAQKCQKIGHFSLEKAFSSDGAGRDLDHRRAPCLSCGEGGSRGGAV